MTALQIFGFIIETGMTIFNSVEWINSQAIATDAVLVAFYQTITWLDKQARIIES